MDVVELQTKEIMARGNAAMARRDFKAALKELDVALAALGDCYQSADSIDDTGMKLVLADTAAQEGRTEDAAAIKHRVVEARLAMLQAKRNKAAR